MALTKFDLVGSICNQCGVSKANASKVIEALLETIKSTLESGESVMISGFGKFAVKEKRTRRGRNPQTGDDLMLDARRVVKFQCSGALREKINGSNS